MNNNLEREKLKILYEELKNSPLPKFSKQNVISNWIEELIEVDTFYAGLSLSASKGENISKSNLYDLSKLKYDLDFIKNSSLIFDKIDLEIIESCYNYFKIIQNIDLLLKKISN